MPTKREKPEKPRKDYPLSWHPSGQWVKKIKGRLYDFGTDPDAAEDKYLFQKEDLQVT